MPRAGGEDEAEKTAPKPGEKQVEIAGVAVAAKGRESQGWMGERPTTTRVSCFQLRTIKSNERCGFIKIEPRTSFHIARANDDMIY